MLDNAILNYESLLEFQEVYLRAVAHSWTNAEFKRELLENPAETIERYFGYRLPWALDFKLKEGGKYENGVWDIPPHTICVGIPDAPLKFEDQAIALSLYNDSGPIYLFSCC